MWRIVLREKATLREIEESWDLVDVADANEAIDISDDVAEWDRKRRKDEDAAIAEAGKLAGM